MRSFVSPARLVVQLSLPNLALPIRENDPLPSLGCAGLLDFVVRTRPAVSIVYVLVKCTIVRASSCDRSRLLRLSRRLPAPTPPPPPAAGPAVRSAGHGPVAKPSAVESRRKPARGQCDANASDLGHADHSGRRGLGAAWAGIIVAAAADGGPWLGWPAVRWGRRTLCRRIIAAALRL
jgi:hypothetical protein